MLKAVTSLFNSTARRRPNIFGRGLASVLLLLVVYGSTVEAVHSHGGLVPARTAEARTVTQTNDRRALHRLGEIGQDAFPGESADQAWVEPVHAEDDDAITEFGAAEKRPRGGKP